MLIRFPFTVIASSLEYLVKPNNQLVKKYKPFHVLLAVWFVSIFGAVKLYRVNYRNSYFCLTNDSLYNQISLIKKHCLSITVRNYGDVLGYRYLNIVFNKLHSGYVGFSFVFTLISNILLVKYTYSYPYAVISILTLISGVVYSKRAIFSSVASKLMKRRRILPDLIKGTIARIWPVIRNIDSTYLAFKVQPV
jgi:hypothetical protein